LTLLNNLHGPMNYKFSRPCNTLKSAWSSSHAIVRWPLIPCGR